MKLGRMFARSRLKDRAEALYGAVVAQARRPEFYGTCGVPDTLDGRFDMIALHAFLLMRRLGREGEAGARLSQALFDTMFADMDRNIREMGVGDLGVGRRVKDMVRGLYGRIKAYEEGLARGEATLGAALRRNLFGFADPAPGQVDSVAAYVRREAAALAARPAAELLAGRVRFGPAPTAARAPDEGPAGDD